MKKFLRHLLVFMLISFLVLNIFNGYVLPTSIVYLISTLLLISMSLFIASSILGFLTIKENFITFLLMSTIVNIGMLFLINTLMPDFAIEAFEFMGVNLGSIVINSFDMQPIVSILLSSILISLITSFYLALEKGD